MAGASGMPERGGGLPAGLHEVGRHGLVAGHHQSQWALVDDLGDRLPALAGFERVEIGELLLADDLHPVGVDDVEVAGERRPTALAGVGREDALPAVFAREPTQPKALAQVLEQLARGDASIHGAFAHSAGGDRFTRRCGAFHHQRHRRRPVRGAPEPVAETRLAQHLGELGEEHEMLVGEVFRRDQAKDQIDRLLVGGLKSIGWASRMKAPTAVLTAAERP